MTKQTDPAMSAPDRPALAYGVHPAFLGGRMGDENSREFQSCPLHFARESDHYGNDRPPVKGLALTKAYLEGGLFIAFIFSGTETAVLCSVLSPTAVIALDKSRSLHHYNLSAGEICIHSASKKYAELKRCHSPARTDRNDELVFVCDIESVKAVEPLTSAWVRLHSLNFSDDLFSGKLCLSIRHGGYKAVLLPRERELHALRALGATSDHGEHQNIESAPKVVDSVTETQRNFIREGHLLFDGMGLLQGFCIPNDDETKRIFCEVGIDAASKLVDVMLCPIDLE